MLRRKKNTTLLDFLSRERIGHMHEGTWAGQKAILYCAYDNHEQPPQSPDGVHDSQGRVIVTETCPEHLKVMREWVLKIDTEILTLRK